MSNTHELMSVAYTETDSGWPALCFCNDFIVAITNNSFVTSFLSYVEAEMVFKIAFLSGNKLTFKVAETNEDSPEDSILEVYLNRIPMGYVKVGSLVDELYLVKDQLKRLKDQSE